MPNDVIEVENELRSVAREKRWVEEQIMEFRQRIHQGETWLKNNAPTTIGYQQTVEEVLALQAYVEELQAQVACLDDVLLELTLEREQWLNPHLALAV
jgi:predicted  nucleic acid-binding Zn-ribbon protein